MQDFTMTISSRKKRKKVAVSLSHLSRLTGYTKSHLSRVLSKKTTPSTPCLRALSLALDIEMGELDRAIRSGYVYAKAD